MAEYLLTTSEARAAANNCMQAVLVADGLRMLGRDTLEHLMNVKCYPEVWSPDHMLNRRRLRPLRYHYVQIVNTWAMKWCDDQGTSVCVDHLTPLFVTIRHAGAEDYPFAVQVGAAIEVMLANRGYSLIDYRQHEALQVLVAKGELRHNKPEKK